MGQLERINDNLPQNTPGNDSESLPARIRDSVSQALSNMTSEKISVALASLCRHLEFAEDIKAHLTRETVLRAYIPKHLEAEWKAGDLKFMVKKDTGEQLGALVGKDNPMNKGYVRIEEGFMPEPSLIHSISGVAMQQQLAHMAAVLDDVRSKVILLQETQDRSLYGELRGMHQQLIQMRDAQNSDVRKHLAIQAITSINKIRGKIAVRLIDEIKNIPDTPDNVVAALFFSVFKKDFVSKVIEGYDRAQELFSYYLSATQMLAYAFAFLDEERSYASVFIPDSELMNEGILNKLIRAETIVGSDDYDWYKKPEAFLGRIRDEAKLLFETERDHFMIDFTGEQLLEAIEDGKQESEEE